MKIHSSSYCNVRKVLTLISLVMILFMVTSIYSPIECFAKQPEREYFIMNDFKVYFERVNISNPDNLDLLRPGPEFKFRGSGYILIKNQKQLVKFDVSLQYNKVEKVFIATDGKVKGVAGSNVSYILQDYKVILYGEKMLITTTNSFASAKVKTKKLPFSNEILGMVFDSPLCSFKSDGSVGGKNFRSSGSFTLKSTDAKINVDQNADFLVKLGPNKALADFTRLPAGRRFRRPEFSSPLRSEWRDMLVGDSPSADQMKFEGIISKSNLQIRQRIALRFTPLTPKWQNPSLLNLVFTFSFYKFVEETEFHVTYRSIYRAWLHRP